MNNIKLVLILLLATSFAFTSAMVAQEAPAKPEPKQAENSDADNSPDEKPQDENKKAEEKQESDDEKSDDEDNKSDDGKSDDDKSDDDKSDDDKSDDDKPGKSDEDEADKSASSKKAKRSIRWTRDSDRLASFSKQSKEFVGVFEPVVDSVNASTLIIVSGKRQIALGTVVDVGGMILTKASELRGKLGCKLNDGTIVEAQVIGIDPDTDLAMLKIEADDLTVAQWSDEPSPMTGRWLATPKANKELPAIGVVSVETRAIPPSRPFIGIVMTNVENNGGVRIDQVVPRSPADFADLWVNDIIVAIDGTDVADNIAVRDVLGQYDVNDRVTLTVKRGSKELKIKLTLAERDKVSPENERSNQQNRMGSVLSKRRKDFPNAFQHDSMLTSNTCGGPIVDLSGKIVGINIARAGRVSSLALPVELVREKVALLKTGDLAPEVVNKAKIEQIDLELAEIQTKLGNLPDKKTVLERKYNVEKARMDEVRKTVEELNKRLKVIEVKSKNYKTELDTVRKELRGIEKIRRRLEADRMLLRTGSR